jgi:LPXTG-site transpeptidase (sortase) family protein
MYIAGHRTTHGAPFRWTGELRAGDRVVVDVPYATATYSVTRHAFVGEKQTQILHGPARDELRLQASTIPPGHTRLVVFARLIRIVTHATPR